MVLNCLKGFPRGKEIITMVAQGMSNQSIGQKLFISDKTSQKLRNKYTQKTGA